MIRLPGGVGAGRVVQSRVSLVSVMATILDLVGVDRSSLMLQGESLVPLLESDAADSSETIFCEVDFDSDRPADEGKRTHKKAIIWDRYKLIRDEDTGRVELYDLTDDPNEKSDLSAGRQRLVPRLLEILEKRIELVMWEDTDPDKVDLTAEELDRLRALGYLGG
jgi:arylsulfatase A-like enzyme